MPSKTKIYLINQSEYEVTSAEEMNILSNNVLKKTEQAKSLKVQLKELKSKTAEISGYWEFLLVFSSMLCKLLNEHSVASDSEYKFYKSTYFQQWPSLSVKKQH